MTRGAYEQAAEHCGQIEAGDLLSHVDSLDIAKGAPSSLLADLIAGPQVPNPPTQSTIEKTRHTQGQILVLASE